MKLNQTPTLSNRGVFEPPQTTTITRTFERPVTESQRLGSIPDDYYEWNPFPSWPSHGTWGWSDDVSCHGDSCELGSNGVYRDVPVYTEGGKPAMHSVTETLSETSYSQKNRVLGFGATGAAAGVGGAALAGALAGVGAVHPVAMVAGAVLGAAAGAALGYKSAQGDEVKEQWETRAISHPHMTGYTHRIDPDTYYEETNCREVNGHRECDRELRVRGYRHTYSPNIYWQQVGQFDEPTLVHTRALGPIAGGALTALAGGVAGAGIGLLLNAL